MQLDRVLVVTKRVFVDLINDKRTLIVMFLTPIITMAIFGVAFGNYVADVPVIVVNKDEGYLRPSSNAIDNIANKIIANLDTRVVKVKYSDNVSEAIGRVKHGEAFAVIVFPEQFTRSVYTWTGNQSSSDGNTIKVIVDRGSIVVSDAVKNSVNEALLKTAEGAVKKTPINIDAGDTIYGQKIEPIDLSFPGVMTFALFVMTTGLTIISLVEERTSGTLNRIFASPLRESETVLGYTISYSFIAVGQAALFLTVGVMIFNVTIIGNVMLVFAISALLSIVSQSLGILLSSTAKRLIHVSITAPFVFLVVLLLSGVYFPVQQIPSPLRPWSYVLPPTYAVDAMRSVILNGWGLDVIWPDILALCAFAVIFLTLATWSLKIRKGA